MRWLIVNADDLGYDPEIDRGILEAHARGLVTSATAMVETPFAAAALARAPRSLELGLHAVVDPGAGRAGAEAALRRQLDRFEALRGAPPTHLDSHKHAHAAPAVREAFCAVAAARALPVRSIDPALRAALRAAGVATADAFLGDAARRPAWTEDALLAALDAVGEGVTELMAHPGHAPSHARTSFGAEREIELAALCSPRARARVEARNLRLCGWSAVGRPSQG
ncbi:YdjC family protein [Anaeromyxobacter dehalogenans 2CP-1]|uniref:YdjC family protein n=1 Tax=Anaeromyxobacter dehalogenans (strain ATCC BAA-258 / DSM 21875 / 2CP-1) TaxID=455488 RepID=B8JAE3_ANAD2|nr:ChbG/HpnK family deacetylase [Anaeromyxobacter dehalogenans]ACL65662.1 YdjC family protein [Anaeromyxobacter dehalogenans 2CP-1]